MCSSDLFVVGVDAGLAGRGRLVVVGVSIAVVVAVVVVGELVVVLGVAVDPLPPPNPGKPGRDGSLAGAGFDGNVGLGMLSNIPLHTLVPSACT